MNHHPATLAPAGRVMHSLLVADDPNLGRVLLPALESNGHRPTWCARAAVAAIPYLSADFVLVDLDKPDKAGQRLLARLRRISTAPTLALVAGSQFGEVTSDSRDAETYLVKPVDSAELMARIKLVTFRASMRAN